MDFCFWAETWLRNCRRQLTGLVMDSTNLDSSVFIAYKGELCVFPTWPKHLLAQLACQAGSEL